MVSQTDRINVPLTPDAEALHSELQQDVVTRAGIWSDLITAATGDYILRSVASIGADCMFATERAQHEVMLGTARRPSSIYAIAQMQGVHISRKVPSAVSVEIARPNLVASDTVSSLVIPAYSRWSVEGRAYFNRGDIMFGPGITVITATLYRGEYTSETFQSDGRANLRFQLAVKNFRVSELDLHCTAGVPARKWSSTTRGLWEHTLMDPVFQQRTTIDGGVIIEFGDGAHGAIPPFGAVKVNYITVHTNDYDETLDLNPPSVGALVDCLDDTKVAGVVNGQTSAAAQERDPNYYKRHLPHIRTGRLFGNNRKNMLALALEYPGVLDAKLMFQGELNPNDLRLMTSVGASLLTASTWGDAEWNLFINYMHIDSCSARHFYRINSVAVPINFKLIVRLAARADIVFVETKIRTVLAEMFAKKYGLLGLRMSLNDIGTKIREKTRDPYGDLLTSLKIVSPVSDIEMLYFQYPEAIVAADAFDIKFDPKEVPVISQGITVPGNQIGVRG